MRKHDDGGNARRADQADRGILGETDFHLLAEGTHAKLYEKLGAHAARDGERPGTRFAVWAPNAESVDVVGDWNELAARHCAAARRRRYRHLAGICRRGGTRSQVQVPNPVSIQWVQRQQSRSLCLCQRGPTRDRVGGRVPGRLCLERHGLDGAQARLGTPSLPPCRPTRSISAHG